jgi:hypothetical protein
VLVMEFVQVGFSISGGQFRVVKWGVQVCVCRSGCCECLGFHSLMEYASPKRQGESIWGDNRTAINPGSIGTRHSRVIQVKKESYPLLSHSAPTSSPI